jgi:hypothetical protein
MQPKTFWKIGLILLCVLFLLYVLAVGIVYYLIVSAPFAINPVIILPGILIVVLFLITNGVTLGLFAMKKKAGYYLSLIWSGILILISALNLVGSLLLFGAFQELNMPGFVALAYSIILLFLIFFSCIFISTWKSKPVFEAKK